MPFTNNEAERDGRMMKVKTEDLHWLPQPRGRYELRDHPVPHRNGTEARLERHPSPQPDFKAPRRQVASRLTGDAKPHGAMASSECGGTTKPGQLHKSLHGESS